MLKGFFTVPETYNEPVKSYAPETLERVQLKQTLEELKSKELELPMIIGGQEVKTDNVRIASPPHEKQHVLGRYSYGDESHVKQATEAALAAKDDWAAMSWEHRASVFLKAADLLAGPFRAKLNASTMLGQSKNVYQAEIDAACELIDFFRFNVRFMTELYEEQPESSEGIWNRMEYRPLEGFVFAVTPFNFTSIAGNLPTAPALMGNTVVWKPAETQVYSAHFIMELLKEAGLPDGVINMVHAPGVLTGNVCFNHREFAGIHFTGSTNTFKTMWKIIGENISNYRYYPRIVGETGGKDFIIAHESADVKALGTALSRGAFEYQGQKCSAVSRAYIPATLWKEVKALLEEDITSMKMGGVEDFSNFINAVIDEMAFDKISGYIDFAKESQDAEIIIGGDYDKAEGFFIRPTVIQAKTPKFRSMCEEIFGPVLTVFVYEPREWEAVLKLVDENEYALTGAVFAQDRKIIEQTTTSLVNAAGNFYINDKPTGAVVGQQPFGGGRGSGTNDKAGSKLNLMRWVSPRTIKENFVPPAHYPYPFMIEE